MCAHNAVVTNDGHLPCAPVFHVVMTVLGKVEGVQSNGQQYWLCCYKVIDSALHEWCL